MRLTRHKTLIAALLACSTAATLFLPGVANAGGDTSHHDRTHLDVHFPDGSPSRTHGGTASISVCDFDSLDAMRDHFDGGKSDRRHDDIDKAFTDAVKIDGKTGNTAFDYRHKGCDKGHHDGSSSSSHHQTKVIPKGAPATGDGPLDDGSLGPS